MKKQKIILLVLISVILVLSVYAFLSLLPKENTCKGSYDASCICKEGLTKVIQESNGFVCVPADEKYEMVVEGYIERDPSELPMNAPTLERVITTRRVFWNYDEAINRGFCTCITNIKNSGKEGRCVLEKYGKTTEPLTDPLGAFLLSCRSVGECWDEPCYDCSEGECNKTMIIVK